MTVAVAVDGMLVQAELAQEFPAAFLQAFGHQVFVAMGLRLLNDYHFVIFFLFVASRRFIHETATTLWEESPDCAVNVLTSLT